MIIMKFESVKGTNHIDLIKRLQMQASQIEFHTLGDPIGWHLICDVCIT